MALSVVVYSPICVMTMMNLGQKWLAKFDPKKEVRDRARRKWNELKLIYLKFKAKRLESKTEPSETVYYEIGQEAFLAMGK